MSIDIHISKYDDLKIEVNVWGDSDDPFATVRLKSDDDDVKLFIGTERARQIAVAILDELDALASTCEAVDCTELAVTTVTWYNPERDVELDHRYCQLHTDRIVEVKVDNLVVTTTPIATVAS